MVGIATIRIRPRQPPPPVATGAFAGGDLDRSLCSGFPWVEIRQTLPHVQHSQAAPSVDPFGKRILRPQLHRPAS